MNTLDEAIAVLQAMKEGKVIQYKISNDTWVNREESRAKQLPNFHMNEYRVKPEPKKVWVIRAEITYNGPATAISWEYNDAQAAQNTFKQLTREGVVGYKNATIEEKELPCQ